MKYIAQGHEPEPKPKQCDFSPDDTLISVSPLFTYIFIYVFLSFCHFGLHQWRMEVPRLGVELELQPPAYVGTEPHLQPTPQLMALPDP